MRIRSRREKAEPWVELRGAENVKSFFLLLEFLDHRTNRSCSCAGEFELEVRGGGKGCITLVFLHGEGLRWSGGPWKGDAKLSRRSYETISRWFAEHNYDSVERALKEAASESTQASRDEKRFLECFPEKARTCFTVHTDFPRDQEEKELGRRLARIIDNPSLTVQSACCALGLLRETWGVTGRNERIALAAAGTVSASEFFAALEDLKNNRDALLGGARLFFLEGYAEKVPAELRGRWGVLLAEVVFDDGYGANKLIALRGVAKIEDPEVRDLLWKVSIGERGQEIDILEQTDDEPGLRAGACLELAKRKDPEIKALVEKRLETPAEDRHQAAHEVCLALLGDPKFLKAAHFKLRSLSIGLSEIEAIERFKGKEGLEALVEGALDHPWALVREEAVLAMQRITGQQWYQAGRNERAEWYIEDVRKWWKSQGEGFVRRKRAEE